MGRRPVPPSLAELAARLKAARERRKLTLLDVFNMTGIHVGRLESNRANMTVLTLLTLCRLYMVQPAEVVAGLEKLPDQ